MSSKPGINVVCFLPIADKAEGLEIADIVLTATGEGNDMVNSKVNFYSGFTAASALIFVTLQDIFLYFRWNPNAGSFAHNYLRNS